MLGSMPGKLTTHVLDTAHGNPAPGVLIELLQNGETIASCTTNADGRCPEPLLADTNAISGPAQLLFHIGDYFRAQDTPSPFLDVVPVSFQITPGENYHVPLVCSPWSYSTYRGS
ncbi:MAG: hydroxyisourate hydrolase [Verrucomicrobiota bacterium]